MKKTELINVLSMALAETQAALAEARRDTEGCYYEMECQEEVSALIQEENKSLTTKLSRALIKLHTLERK